MLVSQPSPRSAARKLAPSCSHYTVIFERSIQPRGGAGSERRESIDQNLLACHGSFVYSIRFPSVGKQLLLFHSFLISTNSSEIFFPNLPFTVFVSIYLETIFLFLISLTFFFSVYFVFSLSPSFSVYFSLYFFLSIFFSFLYFISLHLFFLSFLLFSFMSSLCFY